MKKIIVFLISIFLYNYTLAQSYIVDSTDFTKFPFIYKTNDIIKILEKDPVLKNAKWGFVLYDPETKKEIINKDGNKTYIPASTTKIISSEAALRTLGSDFTWKTLFSYTGDIDTNGTLNGNLYILWNGDPTLGFTPIGGQSYNSVYENYYQALLQNNIKNVKGQIIFESVVFPSEKHLYSYDSRMIDFGDYFSLIPTSTETTLSKEEEEFNKNDKEALTDEEESLEAENVSEEDMIINDIIKSLEINIKLASLQSIGAKNESLAAPPSYFTKLFFNYLQKKGIKISGGITQQDYKNLEANHKRNTLSLYQSPKLSEVVYYTNQKSNNTYAEHLLRTVGIFIGKRDSKYNSVKTVTEKLAEMNFDYEGFNFTDGSGLSYEHKISPVSQVKLLSEIMRKPYADVFYYSLPSAGETGTLRNMFLSSPFKGNIHAKTGTLRVAKTLAGYIDMPNGKRLTFSLLINYYSGSVAQVKQKMELLLNSIYYQD